MLFQDDFAQTMIQLFFHVVDCQSRAIKCHGAYVIGFMTFYIACRPDHFKVIQQTAAVHLLGAAGESRTYSQDLTKSTALSKF